MSSLTRRAGLRRRPKRVVESPEQHDARLVWKTPRAGFCECGCERFTLHLEHHHVTTQERLKQLHREDLLCGGDGRKF